MYSRRLSLKGMEWAERWGPGWQVAGLRAIWRDENGWEKLTRQPTPVPDKCPENLFKGIHHLDTAPRTQETKQADKYSSLQASVNLFVGAM